MSADTANCPLIADRHYGLREDIRAAQTVFAFSLNPR
jgi:hypothetical protein